MTFSGCTVLQNAFKSYVRTRDYCTSPKHIMTMCLNAVRVAVEMNNFMHVTNYVSKAEQTPGTKVNTACCSSCNPAAA
jgi:COP9 signalosome complex subunit 1